MNFPDFSQKGYHIIEELGHNHAGGRVTYLASTLASTDTEEKVVIKEFQFAKNAVNSWAEYDAYQREIEVLQGLNHPGIPRYLDSFETAQGFCLVQEYKNAQPLSLENAWVAKDIKKIAIAILEILAYLQNRIPPVFHRDIKPENILVDGELNVYLVDFGFAHIGQGEVAMSSMVKGTLGFMPPEQLFNQELTLGSDLYGVGATLICLLTKTKSVDIGNLIDAYYRINFKSKIKSKIRRINPDLINWLEKMVEPKPKERFPDANTALEALKPLEVRPTPKVNCSVQIVEVTAREFSEQLNSQIVIQNPIRGTMLTGRLQIAPHPNDPKVKPPGHAWIHISPRHFKQNQVECNLTISTKKLQADSTYEREILLITNASNEPYRIPLRVNTASLPKQSQLPYGHIATLFGLSFLFCGRSFLDLFGAMIFYGIFRTSGFLLVLIMMVWLTLEQRLSQERQGRKIGALTGLVMAAAIALVTGNLALNNLNQGMVMMVLAGYLGANSGAITEIVSWRFNQTPAPKIAKVLAGAIAGTMAALTVFFSDIKHDTYYIPVDIGIPLWLILGMLVSAFAGIVVCDLLLDDFTPPWSVIFSLLTIGLGITLGMVFLWGWWSMLFSAIIIAVCLGKMISPTTKRLRLIKTYQKNILQLIKP